MWMKMKPQITHTLTYKHTDIQTQRHARTHTVSPSSTYTHTHTYLTANSGTPKIFRASHVTFISSFV